MHFAPFTGFIVLYATLFSAIAAAFLPRQNIGTVVNLRVEGLTRTIFEGPIFTRGHNVTTASGGTHHCDGTNLDANPSPGPTATSALSDASHAADFTFDGTFDPEFDDFFITRIGPDSETATQFWGIILNFNFTTVGGCQQRVTFDDQVLFAFDAFNKAHFLKLEGPLVVETEKPATLTVTDGTTGHAISGATVAGLISNSNGHVTINFSKPGLYSFKATRADSIRSNKLEVVVV